MKVRRREGIFPTDRLGLLISKPEIVANGMDCTLGIGLDPIFHPGGRACIQIHSECVD